MRPPVLKQLLPIALVLALVLAFGQFAGHLIWGNPTWPMAGQIFLMHMFAATSRVMGMVWIASRLASGPRRLNPSGIAWVFVCALAWGVCVDLVAVYFWVTTTDRYLHQLLWQLVLGDLIYAIAIVAIVVQATRAHIAAIELEHTELEQRGQGRELDDARLQLLQAQAEPHFLFNALANVRHLLRTEGVAAKALLGDLLQYLQVALPALREAHTSLARETELVRAYLAIHQVRMGGRLVIQVEVPAELGGAQIPSLTLLTLVENAIKHGVGPLVEGGSITVRAERSGETLHLSVADTGKGMGSGSGGGTGLANLRLRLKAMFGSDARLSLALAEPRGMVARVQTPWREVAA